MPEETLSAAVSGAAVAVLVAGGSFSIVTVAVSSTMIGVFAVGGPSGRIDAPPVLEN